VSDTLAREEKMENRGEGKSDGSRETAATECFLLVLFLFKIDRQYSQKKKKKKRKKNEDDDDDEENSRGGDSSSGTS
jgi:hypothetical protein